MDRRLLTSRRTHQWHSLHQIFVLLLIAAFICMTPAVLLACMWDSDTLQQECSRFPTTLELITGKFLRHSQEFYKWRIQDRLKRLKDDPVNLGFYDDLGVAYEKIGQRVKAIEVMEAKEKIKPGLYETYSNWGTFYILAGELELGLPLIDKALAINPDAHFGREKYQKWLVEYALSRKHDGKITFPLRGNTPETDVGQGFYTFLTAKLGQDDVSEPDLQSAVKGLLGMMRFANHENPLLLETLGDLLSEYQESTDAKQLATRCYLKASYVVADSAAQRAYRGYAAKAIELQLNQAAIHTPLELSQLERQFQIELADANRWYATLRDNEIGWIQHSDDVESQFNRLYKAEPNVRSPVWWTREMTLGLFLIGLLAAGCVAIFMLMKALKCIDKQERAIRLWWQARSAKHAEEGWEDPQP